MGFFTRIISLIMAILMTIFPFFGNGDNGNEEVETEPRSITVNGVTYRNKFMGDYNIHEDMLKISKDPVYKDRSITLYKIVNIEEDLLYHPGGGKSTGDEISVYCREDEWETLRAYCADDNNFDYFCDVDNTEEIYYNIGSVDHQKYNKLNEFCDKNSIDPFDLTQNNQLIKVPYDIGGSHNYSFIKISKNGLFCEHAFGFYLWEGKLVKCHHSTGSPVSGSSYIVYVPDELGNYFVDIIYKFNLQ